MTAVRQDAWNHDEDLLLAETVLRHIREGSTQLSAFEEVGKKLSRTAAACGFRWNSLVRKKYESAIALAKKQRKELKQRRKSNSVPKEEVVVEVLPSASPPQEVEAVPAEPKAETHADVQSLDEVIAYLQRVKNQEKIYDDLERENATLRKQFNDLKQSYETLQTSYYGLQREFSSVQEDHKAMLAIMDRARKMVSFTDGSSASVQFELASEPSEEKKE